MHRVFGLGIVLSLVVSTFSFLSEPLNTVAQEENVKCDVVSLVDSTYARNVSPDCGNDSDEAPRYARRSTRFQYVNRYFVCTFATGTVRLDIDFRVTPETVVPPKEEFFRDCDATSGVNTLMWSPFCGETNLRSSISVDYGFSGSLRIVTPCVHDSEDLIEVDRSGHKNHGSWFIDGQSRGTKIKFRVWETTEFLPAEKW